VLGTGTVGAQLLEQPIQGIFFTGSYATGIQIARIVAPRMLKLQLELGGKDPAYVADDVDIAAAAQAVAEGVFYNTGQSCCAVERVYVHQNIWDLFLQHFLGEVQSYLIGDPLDEQTYIGPLARRQAQIDHLSSQVRDALDQGARLLLGGRPIDRPGYFFAPTVLTDVSHQMRIMTEETFGPLIGLMKVESDEQAEELMNDTQYGLTAAVYCQDQGRAARILERLEVGSAYWNCCDRVSPRLPWSGRKHSGVGCTLSTYGIEAFLRPKAWHLRQPPKS
jgi:acyl-CoA reductase-like NAD-dependent aldehyde dehydrogenase